MKRAELYLWSLLQSVDHVNESVLSDLADQAASTLPMADPELRKADMQAAAGAWAERTDLPDSGAYIDNLRNEVRDSKLVTA